MANTQTGLLDGALLWLRTNLVRFNPIGNDARPDPLRSKALAELAFFCDYFRRSKPNRRAEVEPMLEFVAAAWRRDEYQDLVVRHPESLQLYILTYDSLLRSGFEVSDFSDVIQSVIDAGYAAAIEAVPFRAMDFRHVLDYGGFKHQLPAMQDLFSRTMLQAKPPLHYLTKADVYCLTHTLFYATDFGFRTSAQIPHQTLKLYQPTVAQLLGLYVRQQDWDLTAELLICDHCLESEPAELTKAAWTGLLQAQRSDGLVPAPVYQESVDRDADGSKERDFEDNYHTTLVAALAASLCPPCSPELN